jgi:hypothetical protein
LDRSCLADKINNFTNILDALPHYQVITRNRRFLDVVALGMSTGALTLATYNSAQISTLEIQIVTNSKKGQPRQNYQSP